MTLSERLRNISLFGWVLWAPVALLSLYGFVPVWIEVALCIANFSLFMVALWLWKRESDREVRKWRARAG